MKRNLDRERERWRTRAEDEGNWRVLKENIVRAK